MTREHLVGQFLRWHNAQPHAQQLEARHIQSVVIHAWPRRTYDCALHVNYSYSVGTIDAQSEQAFETAQALYLQQLQIYELQMLRWEEKRRHKEAELRRNKIENPDDMTHGLSSMAHSLAGFGGPSRPAVPTLASYAKFRKHTGSLTGGRLKAVLFAPGPSGGLLWRHVKQAGGAIDEATVFAGVQIERHETDAKELTKAVQDCAKEAGTLVQSAIAAEQHSLVADISVDGIQPTQAPTVEWRYGMEVKVSCQENGKTRSHTGMGFVRLAADGTAEFASGGNPLFTAEHAAKRLKVTLAVCASLVAAAGLWMFMSHRSDEGTSPAASRATPRVVVRPPAPAIAPAPAAVANAEPPAPAPAPEQPLSPARKWALGLEPTGLLVDPYAAVSTESKSELVSALTELEGATGWHTRVLVVPDSGKATLEEASREVANYWQAERGQDIQLLVLVTTRSREVRLEVSNQLSTRLTNEVAQGLLDQAFKPAAGSGGFEAGLLALLRELDRTRKASV